MGQIVAMIPCGGCVPTGKIKKRVWQTQPPFEPAYTLHSADGGPPAPRSASSGPMPSRMFCAAMEADVWNLTGRKGTEPEFVTAVHELCRGRVAMSLGCGGSIYLEAAEDAVTLETLFSDAEDEARAKAFVRGLIDAGNLPRG